MWGYIFHLAGGPITWRSKRQPTASRSTREAAYKALPNGAQEGVYLKRLIQEITHSKLQSTLEKCKESQVTLDIDAAQSPTQHDLHMHCNNTSAIKLSKILYSIHRQSIWKYITTLLESEFLNSRRDPHSTYQHQWSSRWHFYKIVPPTKVWKEPSWTRYAFLATNSICHCIYSRFRLLLTNSNLHISHSLFDLMHQPPLSFLLNLEWLIFASTKLTDQVLFFSPTHVLSCTWRAND